MDSNFIIARTTEEDKQRFAAAARRLQTGMSELIITAMRVISGEVLGGHWECRKIHLSGSKIFAIGEEAPSLDGGVLVPVMSFKVVAPNSFWKTLERGLQDQS